MYCVSSLRATTPCVIRSPFECVVFCSVQAQSDAKKSGSESSASGSGKAVRSGKRARDATPFSRPAAKESCKSRSRAAAEPAEDETDQNADAEDEGEGGDAEEADTKTEAPAAQEPAPEAVAAFGAVEPSGDDAAVGTGFGVPAASTESAGFSFDAGGASATTFGAGDAAAAPADTPAAAATEEKTKSSPKPAAAGGAPPPFPTTGTCPICQNAIEDMDHSETSDCVQEWNAKGGAGGAPATTDDATAPAPEPAAAAPIDFGFGAAAASDSKSSETETAVPSFGADAGFSFGGETAPSADDTAKAAEKEKTAQESAMRTALLAKRAPTTTTAAPAPAPAPTKAPAKPKTGPCEVCGNALEDMDHTDCEAELAEKAKAGASGSAAPAATSSPTTAAAAPPAVADDPFGFGAATAAPSTSGGDLSFPISGAATATTATTAAPEFSYVCCDGFSTFCLIVASLALTGCSVVCVSIHVQIHFVRSSARSEGRR